MTTSMTILYHLVNYFCT